ncbi:MAG TPA: hypothetical protein VJ326_08160 [Thermoplasmata archaeon]|nr:hypothetical protein [Thermoplasmata archaeon]
MRADLDALKAPEGYLFAGAPRYRTLFGRDSIISAWQTLGTDPAIARATIDVLAAHQGRRVDDASEQEPGKILHEHRFDAASQAELPAWRFPYYGSIDSTPLFLLLGAAYVSATGDLASARRWWPAFEAAHLWMGTFGDRDGDGFLEYARRNPQGLFHQGWKDGSEDHLRIAPPVALIEVQGYAVAAHRAYASLAVRLGRDAAAPGSEQAESLRLRIDESFWDPEAGFFSLALDGSKRPRRAITSNPGHLLVCEAVLPERVDALVSRLFAPDMFTRYGVRTHASSEPDFDPVGYHTGTVWPHDNWFLYRGLLASGRRSEAKAIREAILAVHEELGRIPELYAVVDDALVDLSREPIRGTRANPLQAWASAGLLDMVRRG